MPAFSSSTISDEINLLANLLNYYSPTGEEEEAVKYLCSKMSSMGYQASIDEAGNVIGIVGEGPRELILLGHIDTVPGFIKVRQENETLWGRGAVDAKGALSCFTEAVARVGPLPGWKFIVIGAVEEEGGSRGAKFIRDKYRPDILVIGEPSSWDRVTLGYKGCTWFTYTLDGPITHTAGREKSVSEQAVDFWNRLQAETDRFNQHKDRLFDQISPTLQWMNKQSDHFNETACLRIGIRTPPGWFVSDLEDLLQGLAGGAVILMEDGVPAFKAEKNTSLVRSFLAAIRAQGGKPRFTLKSGTSDMNIVAPTWNCPAVAYGPGDSNLDHTPDEHINTNDYLRSIEILISVIRSLSTSPRLHK